MMLERVSARLEPEFSGFLARLVQSGDDEFFHPHDFSAVGAREVVALAAEGIDEYWVGLEAGSVVVYGMLRGWREGYEIPSLGLAVDPGWRGKGFGKGMMDHLHSVARSRGATRVRLTVHRLNAGAIALYTSLGYRFQDHSDTALVGFLDLPPQA